MKIFFESWREHALKTIKFKKKKKIKLLTKEWQESYEGEKICYIFRKKLKIIFEKQKNPKVIQEIYHYVGEYRGAVNRIFNLKYGVPEKFPIFFIMDLTMSFILS